MLTPPRLGLFLLATLGAAGCADAEGRYAEFARGGDAGAGTDTDAGACVPPRPSRLDGPALLAVETTLGAGLPILYRGIVTTPELDARTHVVFEYHALDARDRDTEVGEPLGVGPFPIEADGRFVADIPEQTLPGEANPILPGVPIVSTLRLEATICGERTFYCGAVSGSSRQPLIGPVSGRFGLTLLRDDPGAAEPPRYGCDPEDVASPLSPGE